MKKFIGYYILGATTRKDAQDERGLLLWSEKKPSFLRRFLSETLLGIYWIDKPRVLEEKGKTMQSQNNDSQKALTEMPKLAPVRTDAPKQPRKSNQRAKSEIKN